MKKLNLIIILCLMTAAQSYSQFRERVYVMTDKQLYLSGELMWLKLLTTDENGIPVSLSKIGYVELVADSTAEVQATLDIVNGEAAGWIELPRMLPTGYYRLTAYTRYMRNEGSTAFFQKRIGVINPYIRNENSFRNDTTTVQNAVPTGNNISLTTDRNTYERRSSGEIRISGLPAENFKLTVSVVGIDPVFGETSSLLPEWKKHLDEQHQLPFASSYLPEYEGHIIEGLLNDATTQTPVNDPNARALLSYPGDRLQVYGGYPTGDGRLQFITHASTGKREMATVVSHLDGKNLRLDIQSPFAQHNSETLPPLKLDSAMRDFLETRNLVLAAAETYLADSMNRIAKLPQDFSFQLYKSFPLEEYTRMSRMEDLFVEFITMVRIRRTSEGQRFNAMNQNLNGYAVGNMLALLDNIPVPDHERIIAYDPSLIKTINVYLGKFHFGQQMFDGILDIRTLKGDYHGIVFNSATQIIDRRGTQPYRYFYSPVYDGAEPPSRVPDFRHTLLWEPSIPTEQAPEQSIVFYTSSLTGDYLVTVEAITPSGKTLYGVCTFQVK